MEYFIFVLTPEIIFWPVFFSIVLITLAVAIIYSFAHVSGNKLSLILATIILTSVAPYLIITQILEPAQDYFTNDKRTICGKLENWSPSTTTRKSNFLSSRITFKLDDQSEEYTKNTIVQQNFFKSLDKEAIICFEKYARTGYLDDVRVSNDK